MVVGTGKSPTKFSLIEGSAMKPIYVLELILLAAIWGASFLFMRTTTPEFGPFALIEMRTLMAALFLLPLLFYFKGFAALRDHWLAILILGLVNTAIPFCLFSYSTVLLGAGYASIINATAPMFGALVAFLWLKDNLSYLAVAGLFVGLLGVATLSLSRNSNFNEMQLLPLFAALLATFFYGVAACYAKQRLSGVNSLAIATGSQCFSALLLAPLSVVYWPQTNPSLSAWLQLAVLGIVGTGFAYILYFRLIANVGAAKAITVAYLVPVFGVLWGMVFLDEILTAGMLSGATLILIGVSMTTGIIKFRRKLLV
jgi:drug/metabolite transporter (DMT)-like permease